MKDLSLQTTSEATAKATATATAEATAKATLESSLGGPETGRIVFLTAPKDLQQGRRLRDGAQTALWPLRGR